MSSLGGLGFETNAFFVVLGSVVALETLDQVGGSRFLYQRDGTTPKATASQPASIHTLCGLRDPDQAIDFVTANLIIVLHAGVALVHQSTDSLPVPRF